MKKTSPIRDIVHDYIATTELELSVIDSRDFQRLRFVLQNSACYLTYPCNNSTRFTHSLGVMHLSGTLFVRALKNADKKSLKNFLKLADEIFLSHLQHAGGDASEYENPWRERLGNASRFFHNPTVGERFDCLTATDMKFTPEFSINTIWQAVRLGALAHDIGHLPMSHIFEKAMENFRLSDDFKKKYPDLLKKNQEEFRARIEEYTNHWEPHQRKEYDISIDQDQDYKNYTNKLSKMHEARGLYILEKILKKDADSYSRLIISLTRDILISKTKDHLAVSGLVEGGEAKKEACTRNFYRSLHSIFDSSFIDADRIDYTVRDAKVSGLEHGIIDSKRIVDSIALFEINDSFKFSFDARALSAIEFFFHQRYLLYKNLIHHHNALRMDGMVMVILSDLMRFAYTQEQVEISRVLYNHGFFDKSSTTQQFLPKLHEEKYDDGWLRVIFTDVLIAIDGIKDYAKNKKLFRLHLLLETFLYRKTCNVFSYWKREADHLDLYSEAVKVAINGLGSQKGIRPDETPPLLRLLEYMRNKNFSKSDYHKMVEATQKEINEEILKLNSKAEASDQLPHHVTIIYRYVKSAVFSPSGINGYIRVDSNEESCLSKVSPYLKALLALSKNTPVYYVFFVADGVKSREKNGSLKATSKALQGVCKDVFEKHLKRYLNKALEEILTVSAK